MARATAGRTKTIHDPRYAAVLQLLRAQRQAAGRSQADVARELGYSRSVVSKLETGELRMDLIQLSDYCRAIQLPLSTFVGDLETAIGGVPPEEGTSLTAPSAAPTEGGGNRRGR